MTRQHENDSQSIRRAIIAHRAHPRRMLSVMVALMALGGLLLIMARPVIFPSTAPTDLSLRAFTRDLKIEVQVDGSDELLITERRSITVPSGAKFSKVERVLPPVVFGEKQSSQISVITERAAYSDPEGIIHEVVAPASYDQEKARWRVVMSLVEGAQPQPGNYHFEVQYRVRNGVVRENSNTYVRWEATGLNTEAVEGFELRFVPPAELIAANVNAELESRQVEFDSGQSLLGSAPRARVVPGPVAPAVATNNTEKKNRFNEPRLELHFPAKRALGSGEMVSLSVKWATALERDPSGSSSDSRGARS